MITETRVCHVDDDNDITRVGTLIGEDVAEYYGGVIDIVQVRWDNGHIGWYEADAIAPYQPHNLPRFR